MRKILTNIENKFKAEDVNININFIEGDSENNISSVKYEVTYNGKPKFEVISSQTALKSGKTIQDYKLISDIDGDSFQSQNIEEFEMEVIEYIVDTVLNY